MVSRRMSRTGGGAGAALASTALRISVMPRNLPCASSAAAPEKPAIGTGWRNSIAAAVGEPRLDLGQRLAAVLLLRIGNADQREVARLRRARWRSASGVSLCAP